MPDWERKYIGMWKMSNNDYILRSDAVSAFCGNCEATEICRQIGEPCEEVKRIKDIPAADVEPVRHGRWIPINRSNPVWSQFGIRQHKCSECGREEESARKRCPECGAKMDAELPKEEDNART